ncbi:MAG: branched-chain amino acid ABC transporter permease [Lautropia sp.]
MPSATTILQFIVLGLLVGGVYALMGAGLSLLYGVSRILNFAHGTIFALGAYAYYYMATTILSPWLALFLVVPLGFAIGSLIYWPLLTPVTRGSLQRPNDYMIVITIALAVAIEKGIILTQGAETLRPPSLIEGSLNFAGLDIAMDRIVGFIGAAVLVGLLALVVRFTSIGRVWRAMAQNPLGAEVVGIDRQRSAWLAFAVASALATAAGAFLAPLLLIYPAVGTSAIVKGFAIIVIGGLGSVWGACLGGLTLGLVEALGTGLFYPGLRDVYMVALMLLVLLFVPNGLFGERVRNV